MSRSIAIVHAPADVKAAHALAEALSGRARAAVPLAAEEAAASQARCMVALWSEAAARQGEPFFTAMIAALSRDALVTARIDRTGLPFGFRDFRPVRLSGLAGAAEIGGLRGLEKQIDATLGRPRFALSDAAAGAVSSAKSMGALVFTASALVTAGLGAKAVDELGVPAIGLVQDDDRLAALEDAFDIALARLDRTIAAADAAPCDAAMEDAASACSSAQTRTDRIRASLARSGSQAQARLAEAEAAAEQARRERDAAGEAMRRACRPAAATVNQTACAEARRASRESRLRALANAPVFGPAAGEAVAGQLLSRVIGAVTEERERGPEIMGRQTAGAAASDDAQSRLVSCPQLYARNERDWYAAGGQAGYEPLNALQARVFYREHFGAAPGADLVSGLARCETLAGQITAERDAVERMCTPQTGETDPAACDAARRELEAAQGAFGDAADALGDARGAAERAQADPALIDALEAAQADQREACAPDRLEGSGLAACEAAAADAARVVLARARAVEAGDALCAYAEETARAEADQSCDGARAALAERGGAGDGAFRLRGGDMAGVLAALRSVDVWGWLREALPAPLRDYAALVAILLSLAAGWLVSKLLSGLLRLFGVRTQAPKRRLIAAPASDVFVSYARKNADRVVSIADTIERLGLKVWIDRTGIAAGEAWAGKIVEAVRESGAFTLMGSKAAFQSDNVYRELHVAAYLKKPITPFVLDGAEPPDAFLYFMAGTNFVDLKGRSGKALQETLEGAFKRRR